MREPPKWYDANATDKPAVDQGARMVARAQIRASSVTPAPESCPWPLERNPAPVAWLPA